MDIDGVTISDSDLTGTPLVFIARDDVGQPLSGVGVHLFVDGESLPSIRGETDPDGVCILQRPANLDWVKLELYALRDDPGRPSEVLELVGDRWVSAGGLAQQADGGLTVDYHLAYFQPCGLDGAFDEIDDRATGAEADVAVLKTDVAALDTRLAAAEGDITGLKAEDAALGGQIAQVRIDFGFADAKVVADAKTDLAALETKLQKQIDDLRRELVVVRNIVGRGAVPHGDLL